MTILAAGATKAEDLCMEMFAGFCITSTRSEGGGSDGAFAVGLGARGRCLLLAALSFTGIPPRAISVYRRDNLQQNSDTHPPHPPPNGRVF